MAKPVVGDDEGVRVTVPENPPEGVTVTSNVLVVLATKLMLEGAESEKSGPASAPSHTRYPKYAPALGWWSGSPTKP